MRKFGILFFLGILITIDWVTKWFFDGPFQMMLGHSLEKHQYFPLIGDFLGIQLAYNNWVAFSLPVEGIFLQILTILLVIGIGIYYIRYEYPKNRRLLDIAFIMIGAWALSHTYERVFHGYVVDFIRLKYFAIFNFADILITFWWILLIIFYLFYEQQPRKHPSR